MSKPFDCIPVMHYELPGGGTAPMSELIDTTNYPRLCQEIMLFQRALGVPEDGIIGPKTRLAIRALTSNR